jgi:hypothetical protein
MLVCGAYIRVYVSGKSKSRLKEKKRVQYKASIFCLFFFGFVDLALWPFKMQN